MLDPSVLSAITVITSGVVAVGALIISPLINLCIEKTKWNREHKAAMIKDLESSTIDFLDAFQYFSTRTTQVENSSVVFSKVDELRRKFFRWEMTIGVHCNKGDKIFLKETADKILGSHHTLKEYHPDLTNQVLDFSKRIRQKL